MSYFDVIIICLLFGFTLFGFWSGLLHAVGGLIGTLLGAYVANQYFEEISAWVVTRIEWSENTARVVVFLLLFASIARLVGVLVWIAEKLLHILPIPFGKTANRTFGAIVGFLEGTVALGIFVFLIQKFPLSGQLADAINASQVIEWVHPIIEKTISHAPWLLSKLIRLL